MKRISDMDLVQLATYYEEVREEAIKAEALAEIVAQALLDRLVSGNLMGVYSESGTKWIRDDFNKLRREAR